MALLGTIVLAVPLALVAPASPASAAGPCGPPVLNPVACENTKPGSPASEWDITGAGDPSIQGFATDISVNRGDTVHFKVKTDASAYRFDVYRLGFYGGLGARKFATTAPTAALPQTQPACLNDSTTGLIDCGSWSESGSWAVPADAVSGIYVAHVVRPDTGGSSHIVFVVRDDASTSGLVFQTSDTGWQAYNDYGGNSLYKGSPAGRAYKVSYNRPFNTRASSPEDWLFNAEYPMLRWLEANGYDVSYTTGMDSDRRGGLIANHRTFLSVGHDEYWSGNQRANVEAARAAGVNLAFFSGNEMFWKTRWEPAMDGSATPYRTLVTYKETMANAVIDPADPPTWTGTWRDPRFSPPADGGRPENAVSGTIFMVNGTRNDSIQVSAAEGQARFWRNTSMATLAPGTTATLPAGTLGYEWDEDLDNGARPPGLVDLSTATVNLSSQLLTDYGSHYGAGTATHHLTQYRAPSGALVFGAGTVQWSWGLDATHDRGGTPTDVRMQQATVNLLADMRAQPATLQAGLVAAAASGDTTAPTSTITAPASGATTFTGTSVTVSGTAADGGGGVVAGVEVSVDGGSTWHPATGKSAWSYTFTPTASGTLTIKSRAADDSGNLESPAAGITLTVTPGGSTIWPGTATPVTSTDSDTGAVEVGVKVRSDVNGSISGIRFYKGATNGGTHVGSLWTSTGTRLATATFTNESASGWQQVNFASPVPVTANTVYVASYFAPGGHYAADAGYFATQGVDSGPLHALANSVSPDGVYRYSATSAFPTTTYQSTNYWVDVVFSASTVADTTPPAVTGTTPSAGAIGVARSTTVTASFSEAVQPATVGFVLRDPGGVSVAATTTYDGNTNTATLIPTSALAASTTYSATVSGAKDLAGNVMTTPVTWSFTTGTTSNLTIWNASATPTVTADPDTGAVEVGVKVRSDVDGFISGIRFYKGTGNGGTHLGNLWSSSGTRLATATFANESATGWQQVSFASPVAVTANTVYVASYFAPSGHYADDAGYFATRGVDSPPLHAVATTESPDGVYGYGASSTFPTGSFGGANYWVDVVFSTTAPVDTTPPGITVTMPSVGATAVSPSTTVSATFTEPVQPATISLVVRGPGGVTVPVAVAYDAPSMTVTVTPSNALAFATAYTATVSGAKDPTGNTMAPVSWSFTTAAGPANQIITFGALPPRTLAQSPVVVTATASSGLTVTFSTTTPAVCTSGGANGATITLLTLGTCTVQADQAGSPAYNPAPSVIQSFVVGVSTGIAVDKTVIADGRGAVTTAPFSTAAAGELLVAFVAADGPKGGGQTVTVSGAGLTWTLARRTNAQAGTTEVWQALAPTVLSNVTVRSAVGTGNFDQSMTLVAFQGAAGVGASASASAPTGAPSVALTTTRAGSRVFGVGNDWDRAVARTPATGQALVHQWVDTGSADTFWTQSMAAPTVQAGTVVTLSDTAPTNDRWNYTAVEIAAS